MNEFEASQIVVEWAALATVQFQFWMAATFAVVIASSSVGDRLARWARVIIAALYVLAAAQFILRAAANILELIAVANQYNLVDSNTGPGAITGKKTEVRCREAWD